MGKPESFSKKGLGGFASKDRRVARTNLPSGPGPGKYALPNLLQSKADFNKANTSNFHQPIAQSHSRQEVLPSPTAYNVRLYAVCLSAAVILSIQIYSPHLILSSFLFPF